MSYIIVRGSAGLVDVNPVSVYVVTTDSLSTITASGYLQNAETQQGVTILPTDIIQIVYGLTSINPISGNGTFGFFRPTFSNGIISISLWANPGDVLLPVTSGDFAVFNGTTGQIKDAGYLPSNAAKTNVVMANGATIANHIATYTDTAGTVGEDAATAINGGNIQAGLSGTAGSLVSFPTTATTGTLALTASSNSGNFANVITNAPTGQASTWTLADPGGAASKVLQAAGTLVSGNLLKQSGTAGLTVDAGFFIKAGTTGIFAGGSTSNAFTITGLSTSFSGSCVIRASTNAVSIVKAVPTTNTLTVTFSADPGANTTVDYIYSSSTV
ncbi:MAG: hypothetical protein ACYC6W_11015 [Nitrosotalea sp.]